MVLPLIPLALAGIGVVTGAAGTVMGIKGGHDIKKANERIKNAGALYDEQRTHLHAHERATNDALKKLGNCQEWALHEVVDRMAEFLRRHDKQVKHGEKLLVDGLESSPGHVLTAGTLGQDALSWMRGILGSAVTGVGVNSGVTLAVTSLASASTGTAISTLSGAAATNATMAFLGGGSIASGGGGMAAGAAALNFVTIGPALLVSGLIVAGQGEKAQTKARENEAAVNVAIQEMGLTKEVFDAIISRAEELEVLLQQLETSATSALELLESEPFDAERHAAPFQRALTLTMAVRDVATVQVVDDAGQLNPGADRFKLTYRALAKESNHA